MACFRRHSPGAVGDGDGPHARPVPPGQTGKLNFAGYRTMNQAPLRPTWVRVIQVLMAALILNALISFNNVYPTPYVQLDVRIGPEFVALWLVLLVLVALLGRVGRLTIMLLTALFVLIV